MYVTNLKLLSFRNYKSLEETFSPGINYIFGENGAGKTSLVEAIGFLSFLKSFKTSNEKEVITIDEAFSLIEATYVDEKRTSTRKIVISKKGKYLEDDGVEVKKISSIVGDVKIISFLPQDGELFKNNPSARRRFLDQNIAMINKRYLLILNEYYQYLENIRNLIKDEKFDEVTLDILLDGLSSRAIEISQIRKEFVTKINIHLQTMSSYLENQKISLTLNYLEDVKEQDAIRYKEVVKKYLLSTRNKNQLIKGIHLDDLSLTYLDKDLGLYGSQGQNRISVIALKLSLYKIIKDEYHKEAILILDDVLSELDEVHQVKLLILLKRVEQVFITGTEKINEKDINYYQVINKTLRRVKNG